MSLAFGIFGHKEIKLCLESLIPIPFLIIEKAIITFQNIHEFMHGSYFTSKGCNAPRRVEKWIQWIPPIKGRFKLNFVGLRINNISASGWVIRDFSETIKMTGSRHLGNCLNTIAECVALRDGVVAVECNGFLNLKIEGDSKLRDLSTCECNMWFLRI